MEGFFEPQITAGQPFWLKVYIADTETTNLWDVPQKTKVQMIHFSSLLSMLLLLMAEAQKSGCESVWMSRSLCSCALK